MAHLQIIRILIAATMLLLTGCGGSYALRGKVVRGDFSMIAFVPADDARLEGPGLASAKIVVHRDGDRLGAREVARNVSGPNGEINVPIPEFGAGWMIEQWRLEAYRSGYETVDTLTSFPPTKDNQRLLIMMAPGPSSPPRSKDDLWDQYEQFR